MIKTTFKAHPIMIVRLMRPFLFVLVLPLIRAAVQYFTKGEISGLFTLELIAFVFVLTIAIFGWRSIKITVSERYITVKKGFLIKSCAVIEKTRLSSVSLKQNIFDFVCCCVNCAVNTEAGRPKKSDFDIKMSVDDAKKLYNMIYKTEKMEIVRFSSFRIALLAAATSSAFTGIIIGVPVINEISNLVGIAISEVLLNEINVVSSKFDSVFPPIVNTVTIILLIAYVVSFLTSFLKNINFRLKSDKNNIEVQAGLLVQKKIVFKKSKINNICFEQTPLMRIFKKHSMRASVGGYGDSRGERAVIVPMANRSELENSLREHFPFLKVRGIVVEPRKTMLNWNRFLYIPALLAIIIIGASALLAIIFPYFDRVILFLLLIVLGVDIYYGSLCCHNYKFSRFCLDESISAVGSTGLTVKELYCNKNKIGVIKILQTPADRKFKTCKVKFTVRSEGADSVKVKNLDKKIVIKQINQIFKININV